MNRGALVWLAPILIGVLLVVGAPPDPQYSVSVYGPTDPPEGESVAAFGDLSAENRTLFRESFEGAETFAEPPPIQRMYVAYEGDVYQMSASAGEGSVFSLLMPPLGGLFIVAGCLLGVYRELYTS